VLVVIATLSRTYTFEAAHQLPNVPEGHKCGRVHGHSYRVTLVVRGPVQTEGPEAGMVVDFARIDRHAAPLVKELDHTMLNDHVGLQNPTSEHLARWFIYSLRSLVPFLVAVTVRETARSEATVLVADVEHEPSLW
jgi:6-pyruvoyltetrahydropterin/6-carboxytetrahydropterin synthase